MYKQCIVDVSLVVFQLLEFVLHVLEPWMTSEYSNFW